jgi:thiamine-phosphate pyrophosphorylase
MQLYLITDRRAGAGGWSKELAKIGAATTGGCQWIQIRERDVSAAELCRWTREAIGVARPAGARVLVNDRLDVALAAKADGVHLRSSSLPASAIRKALPSHLLPTFTIGVSTHNLEEAKRAEAEGATFVVTGPVFPPHSKPLWGPPMGIAELERICLTLSIPVFALGGITRRNYREVMAAGANGLAGIALFAENPDPRTLVEELLQWNCDGGMAKLKGRRPD